MINYFKKYKKQNVVSQENIITDVAKRTSDASFSSVKTLSSNSSKSKSFTVGTNQSFLNSKKLSSSSSFAQSKKISSNNNLTQSKNQKYQNFNDFESSKNYSIYEAEYDNLKDENSFLTNNLSLNDIYDFVENKLLNQIKY